MASCMSDFIHKPFCKIWNIDEVPGNYFVRIKEESKYSEKMPTTSNIVLLWAHGLPIGLYYGIDFCRRGLKLL